MRFDWVENEGGLRIAQTHRPQPGPGLRGDLSSLEARGARVLVSCLTDADIQRLGLEDEPTVAEAVGLEFLRHSIVDHGLPDSRSETLAFADGLAARLRAGQGVVVHCFAGIGRSGLVVIAALVRAGVPLPRAVQAASSARGRPVPETRAQLDWLGSVPPGEL